MDNGRRNCRSVNIWCGLGDPRYTNSYINPSPFFGTEYGSGLMSTRYPDFNWTGAPSITYPDATPLGLSFVTPPHLDNYVYGSLFHPPQQSSAHANLLQILPSSQVSAIDSGNVLCDPGENQDTGTYPVPPVQREAALEPVPGTTDYMRSPCPAPSHLGDRVANVEASAPERSAQNTKRRCPVCPALLGRLQDRKRHKLSHLPQWLQCTNPGCSWRGDRWENLKKHRLKVHPSTSQESDKCKSIIYDPWPLVKVITDDTTFQNARKRAISLVEKKAIEVGKLELWGNFWGRKERKVRKVYGGP